MNTRCYRCGWSFSLSREVVEMALVTLNETKAKHYDLQCPKCRQKLKLPADQIKRAAPIGWTPPPPAPLPEPVAPPSANAPVAASMAEPPASVPDVVVVVEPPVVDEPTPMAKKKRTSTKPKAEESKAKPPAKPSTPKKTATKKATTEKSATKKPTKKKE